MRASRFGGAHYSAAIGVIASQRVRPEVAGPMTGSAKQSSSLKKLWIASSLALLAMTRNQFAAKQYNSPSPPVERRSAWLQPPSGPREGCDEFHDLDSASSRKPIRSAWPSITEPCL